jgi:serine/threonine protein kinase
MAEHSTCPRCGALLAADAPQGLCPACLLREAMTAPPPSGGSGSPQTPRGSSGSGGRFEAPSPAELAPHFPQLEILELLGQGGMGAVYKARQPGLDRLVALKVLPPELAADPAFAERFTREARAMARLAHAHIVHVYDSGQTSAPLSPGGRAGASPGAPGRGSLPAGGGEGGYYYFLMEYVDGTNLRQLLRGGQVAPREALALVPQLCEALQFAHDEGIVHRDIKPENILIDRRGRVKVADFGLAKLVGRQQRDFTLTGTNQVMGTWNYMAPEQLERPSSVDHRADIYALGVVFYEMLTGHLPIGRFELPSRKVQVDVRLDEVVLRALEREPERRYQRASEIRTDVESIVRAESAGGSQTRPQPPSELASGRRARPAEAGRGSLLSGQSADALPDAELAAARQLVAGPAVALMVLGILHMLPLVVGCVVAVPVGIYWATPMTALLTAAAPAQVGLPAGPAPLLGMVTAIGPWEIVILALVLNLPAAVLILLAGIQMRRLQGYGLCMAGAVIALLPCGSFWLVGIPIGIWALLTLNKPEVKAGFLRAAGQAGRTASGRRQPADALAPVDVEAARAQVRGPAIALALVALIDVLLLVAALAIVPATTGVVRSAEDGTPREDPPWVTGAIERVPEGETLEEQQGEPLEGPHP